MEQIDKVSLISIAIAVSIIAVDLFGIQLPTNLTSKLTNKNTQIALGVGIIIASYYHLPTSIVLASLLYLSLNDNTPIQDQKVPVEAPTQQVESKPAPANLIPGQGSEQSSQPSQPSQPDNLQQPAQPDNLPSPLTNANDVGVGGVLSDPGLEPVQNPLPTQDNSAPVDVKPHEMKLPEGADPTLLNQENLDSLIGFGGNDMASVL